MRRVRRIDPSAPVAVLLGMTTGMAVAGLAVSLDRAMAVSPRPDAAFPCAVTGLALFVLALGVGIPRRFALWVCAMAWHCLARQRRQSGVGLIPLSFDQLDRPLYYTVFAVVALTAGVLSALFPISIRVAMAGYHWMYAHFLWPRGALAVLQAATAAVAGFVPLAALGLAVSAAYRIGSPGGRWEPKTTGWLLVGAASGVWIAGRFGHFRAVPDLLLVASALPVLITVLVAAIGASSAHGESDWSADQPAANLPVVRDRWPALLRASVAAVAAAGAGMVALWARSDLVEGEWSTAAPAVTLAALGVGVFAGCRVRRSAVRSISGSGAACAVAGILLLTSTAAGNGGAVPGPAVAIGLSCVSILAVGFALAYGWEALLNRVADRSYAGTKTLIHMLTGSGLMVCVGVPLAWRWPGIHAAPAGVGLFLLALGGTLIIHESKYSPRTRLARLGAIFASIAAMILAAWLTPQLWRNGRGSDPVPVTDSRADGAHTARRGPNPPPESDDRSR